MSTKHTPGPWTIEGGDTSSSFALYHRGWKFGKYVDESAECGFDDFSLANARLIAAAPELLAALKALLAYADAYANKMREIGRGAEELGEGADSSSVSGMARAAIARAEGR